MEALWLENLREGGYMSERTWSELPPAAPLASIDLFLPWTRRRAGKQLRNTTCLVACAQLLGWVGVVLLYNISHECLIFLKKTLHAPQACELVKCPRLQHVNCRELYAC
jgi:hypothetical protein